MTDLFIFAVYVLMTAALAGCAMPPVKEDFKRLYLKRFVCFETREEMQSKGCNKVAKDDHGNPIGANYKVEACYDPPSKTIFWYGQKCVTMQHELCHAARKPRGYCEDTY